MKSLFTRLFMLALLFLLCGSAAYATDVAGGTKRVDLPLNTAAGEVKHWKIVWPANNKAIAETIVYKNGSQLIRTFGSVVPSEELYYPDGKGRMYVKRRTTYRPDGVSPKAEETYSGPGRLSRRLTYNYDANGKLETVTDMIID
ncbi:MAG: hypothetical protein K2W82_18155 [Candidatus Obscuribacterales bacterium]|nr:hypothetical protein [Candidatus Obscuribacterales bacterium]